MSAHAKRWSVLKAETSVNVWLLSILIVSVLWASVVDQGWLLTAVWFGVGFIIFAVPRLVRHVKH